MGVIPSPEPANPESAQSGHSRIYLELLTAILRDDRFDGRFLGTPMVHIGNNTVTDCEIVDLDVLFRSGLRALWHGVQYSRQRNYLKSQKTPSFSIALVTGLSLDYSSFATSWAVTTEEVGREVLLYQYFPQTTTR
jgi:hypothetical protein